MSKNTITSMAKEFLMENIFDDCYIFEYIEQKTTKKIFNEDEIYNDIKPRRGKDIVKIIGGDIPHQVIIEDANTLGNMFSLYFINHGMGNIQEDKSVIYRELYAMNEEENAPYCMPDIYGDIETLVRYTEIIPISLYKLEL
jgi:hypothetical protein